MVMFTAARETRPASSSKEEPLGDLIYLEPWLKLRCLMQWWADYLATQSYGLEC